MVLLETGSIWLYPDKIIDLSHVILTGMFTLLGVFIGVWINEKIQRDRDRKNFIKLKLEKLYSPLYFFVERGVCQYGEKDLFVCENDRGESEKKFLDKIILENYYLASDDLKKYLIKIHGAGFYKGDKKQPDFIQKFIEILEKEYFALKKGLSK